jgi:hypothetical protein
MLPPQIKPRSVEVQPAVGRHRSCAVPCTIRLLAEILQLSLEGFIAILKV